jgi:hypothetical protein
MAMIVRFMHDFCVLTACVDRNVNGLVGATHILAYHTLGDQLMLQCRLPSRFWLASLSIPGHLTYLSCTETPANAWFCSSKYEA